MSRYVPNRELSVIISSNSEMIPNVYELEKIGAGHDGSIWRFNDKALKILKYDIKLRKEKGLMSYDKALFFIKNLDLRAITQPTDILLDEDGIYTGYVMDFIDDITSERNGGTPKFRNPGDFCCGDLINSWEILEGDFKQLSDVGVRAKDINRGSYLFGHDFMHLCDTDKYERHNFPRELNESTLNFTIAKFLAYEMEKTSGYDKSQKRILDQWVKKCSNSKTFQRDTLSDIANNYGSSISEYADYKAKTLLR